MGQIQNICVGQNQIFINQSSPESNSYNLTLKAEFKSLRSSKQSSKD
jgi:hypothetical protein